MADIISSNALLDDEEKKKQEQSQETPDSMSGAGTSGVVSGAQGNNGLGSGNTQSQPWTNIQAYLGANKDNGSSSKLLTDNVQPGLDKEVDRYGNESKSSLDAGKSQADTAASTYNQFAPNVSAAANGSGNQDYSNQAKSLLQNAYNAKPFSFNTDNTVKTQGDNLRNDDSFYNQQNQFYAKAAGGQLSSGQGALQTQLDVNNENLANTRSNLLKKYSGFQDSLDSNVKGVNDNLAQYEKTYNDNRNNLNNDARSQNSKYNQDYLDSSAALNGGAKKQADSWYNGYVQNPYGYRRPDGSEVNNIEEARQTSENMYNDSINQNTAKKNTSGNQWNYIKSILGG